MTLHVDILPQSKLCVCMTLHVDLHTPIIKTGHPLQRKYIFEIR